MKKFTVILLTSVLTFSLSATAFAAEINQADESPKDTNVTITTAIDPTYTVTIPANTEVSFNSLSTDFGTVKLDTAQLDPGHFVRVTLNTSGTLKNAADASKTIPYTVNTEGAAFILSDFTTAGQEAPLTINITQDDWNTAYAGDYSDTMTFTVSYIEA